MKQNILVLGGHGFLGSHLVTRLVQQGHHVRTLDRSPVPPLAGVESLIGDFSSEADAMRALAGCDAYFHCASTVLPQSSNTDPLFDIETNLKGTVTFLKCAVEAGVTKGVFISSGGTVYGKPETVPIDETHPTHPLCSYAITKLAIEQYLALYEHLYGVQAVVLRLANPFGPRPVGNTQQGVISCFLEQALSQGEVTIWGDGCAIRDYIYITDVVDALVAALAYTGPERVFNIGSGQGRSVNEIVTAIEQTLGKPVRRLYTPGRVFDVPVNVLSIARAQACLGWAPRVEFQAGLASLVQWFLDTQVRSSLLC